MLNKVTSYLYAKMTTVGQYTNNQKGAQAIEYIGIIAAVVVLIGLIMKAMDGSGIGDAIIQKVKDAVDQIQIG